MPFVTTTLAKARLFKGESGDNGRIDFPPTGDELCPIVLALATFNVKSGKEVDRGVLELVPDDEQSPASARVLLQAWDKDKPRGHFTDPRKIPIPPGYHLEFRCSKLPDEATLGVWWNTGRLTP